VSFLRVEHLSRHFGGIRAVEDVSLEAPQGCVFGVIGPNGAGKTTLLNLLSGLLKPTSGEVWFRDERIDGLPAHAIAARGITRTYQNIKLFRGLSARENVVIGQHLVGRSSVAQAVFLAPAARAEERQLEARAEELLAQVGLAGKGGQRADFLSYGDARRLEIARALGARPALLLLDEPAAGMNPAEADRLLELIRELAAGGVTIVLVEHHVGLVMSACQRIAVLNFGVKIAEGSPDEIRGNAAVVEAYLGRE
jgi:ABC-type branched-subunit amino acid transport system ATPase component